MTANQTPAAPDIKARLRQHTDGASSHEIDLLLDAAADHIEALERQLAEASKGSAMYEHIRTLNPSQFTDIWVLNLRGGGSFDDLILADMDKRKGGKQ